MYAKGTKVSVTKSIDEIRRAVLGRGGSQFAYSHVEETGGRIVFAIRGYTLRFDVVYPKIESMGSYKTTSGRWVSRNKVQQKNAYEAEKLRQWRVCLLRIKSKLEVGTELSDQQFYADVAGNVLLADGITIAEAAKSSQMTLLLPSGN